jgi:hypothetical protein
MKKEKLDSNLLVGDAVNQYNRGERAQINRD